MKKQKFTLTETQRMVLKNYAYGQLLHGYSVDRCVRNLSTMTIDGIPGHQIPKTYLTSIVREQRQEMTEFNDKIESWI